ncbi:hypothetical protein SAMN05443270_3552 [Lacrimispora sphenoides]|jgi:hypothetical protein|uniref:hypothetical protein n=1 Tax=Lacrimispora sphenoides TaxID=29370 RepID=UPI0008CADCAB|nr:hypothetical protein [Lacrimispora sphenoides]SEU22943.1 hypothetical protein SAMN05443270_3552 [Lacrimispora sphenoides]
MDAWKDNNLSAILEYPFDFERYIEERLREIDDLDERWYAKKVLVEGLSKVIRCMEAKYRQLERRVYEELEIADNQYETVMTIVKRDHYDPTNRTLHPVDEFDLEEEKLAEILSNEKQVWIGTIFLESGEDGRKEFEKIRYFIGTLGQNGETQEADFYIQPAKRYRDTMEKLYQVFQDNHIPWETINTAYLDKFYDIFISPEGLEKGMKKSILENVEIAFGKFKKLIHHGLIPLWNLDWVKFDSTDFMLPSINDIYYEHEFTLQDKEEGDGYLIETNEDILEIRHEKNKIVIKSQKETFENWKALHIIQQETIRSLDYNAPLVTNHKKDSFIRRFAENSCVQLMTKTDLFRRIMELDIQDYIEVVGYEICENAGGYQNTEGMNWFVRDELFPMESRKVLLLKFRAKEPGHYLNDSMVQFVISQMQLEISEYRCIGVMV